MVKFWTYHWSVGNSALEPECVKKIPLSAYHRHACVASRSLYIAALQIGAEAHQIFRNYILDLAKKCKSWTTFLKNVKISPIQNLLLFFFCFFVNLFQMAYSSFSNLIVCRESDSKRMFNRCKAKSWNRRVEVQHICGACSCQPMVYVPSFTQWGPIGQPFAPYCNTLQMHWHTCCSNVISVWPKHTPMARSIFIFRDLAVISCLIIFFLEVCQLLRILFTAVTCM